jgi:hypothetical protein
MANKKPEAILVTKPAYEVGRNIAVTGRALPSLTFINNNFVPGCDVYVEYGWIWAVPDPNPLIGEHAHDYDQIALHIGTDPHNPEDLGAEFEIVVDGKPVTINKTHSIYLPKGLKHGPTTWKRVDRPVIEMTITLGGGTVEAVAPAGWTDHSQPVLGKVKP